MKLKVGILLHFTTGDQIWIHHQDPKTKKGYEITPVAFHCGSSEEVLLLTNTWLRYLWTEDGLSMNTMETAGNSGFNEYEMLD